jgi:hypothetical protein
LKSESADLTFDKATIIEYEDQLWSLLDLLEGDLDLKESVGKYLPFLRENGPTVMHFARQAIKPISKEYEPNEKIDINDLAEHRKAIQEAEAIWKKYCFYGEAPIPVALLAGIIAIAKNGLSAENVSVEKIDKYETYVVLQRKLSQFVHVGNFGEKSSAKNKCEESAKYFQQECWVLGLLASCIPQATITPVIWGKAGKIK